MLGRLCAHTLAHQHHKSFTRRFCSATKKVEVGEPTTELNKAFVEAAHFHKNGSPHETKIGFGSHLQHAMSRSDPPLAKSAYLKQAVDIVFLSSSGDLVLMPTTDLVHLRTGVYQWNGEENLTVYVA